MRKHALCFLVLVFALRTVALCAQTREDSEQGFTLTISEWHGGLPPSYHWLSVLVTNKSNEPITEPGCSEVRGLYVTSVLYNGVPLEEKDAIARRAREAKDARFCTRELGINKIKPGESFEHILRIGGIYDMSRPGTYEITVSRETDPKPDVSRPGTYLERAPGDPDRSVTVNSNTLIVAVPEPKAVKPK
jgi:hypothetical protein